MKELITYNATLTIGFVTSICGIFANNNLVWWSLGVGMLLAINILNFLNWRIKENDA